MWLPLDFEEAEAVEDAEVKDIMLELADTARRTANEVREAGGEAGEMRRRALRILEILQVPKKDLLGSAADGNFEVEDLTGRTTSECLAMVARELERRAGLEMRKIWALAARRALRVARLVDRLHKSGLCRTEVSVVGSPGLEVRGRLEPEAEEASFDSEQSEVTMEVTERRLESIARFSLQE